MARPCSGFSACLPQTSDLSWSSLRIPDELFCFVCQEPTWFHLRKARSTAWQLVAVQQSACLKAQKPLSFGPGEPASGRNHRQKPRWNRAWRAQPETSCWRGLMLLMQIWSEIQFIHSFFTNDAVLGTEGGPRGVSTVKYLLSRVFLPYFWEAICFQNF